MGKYGSIYLITTHCRCNGIFGEMLAVHSGLFAHERTTLACFARLDCNLPTRDQVASSNAQTCSNLN